MTAVQRAVRGSILPLLLLLSLAQPASAVPPSNDDFANATEITSLPQSASEDFAEASVEENEVKPSCASSLGSSVWFTITPETRTALAVDTWGSSTEVVIAVWREFLTDSIQEIACNNRVWTPTDTPPHSHVSTILWPGYRHWIQVVDRGFCCPVTTGLEIEFLKWRSTPGVRRAPDPRCGSDSSCSAWYLNSGFDPTPEGIWTYNAPNNVPFVGDWRHQGEFGYGTGITSPAVRRNSLWYLTNGWTEGPSTARVIPFGRAVATPVVGDQDGDGSTDIGVVDGNAWFFDSDLNGLCDWCGYRYGSAGDVKVFGDWDGDGDATPGVRKGNVWYLKNDYSFCCDDGRADVVFAYGSANDPALVGDWDGDGDWTVGVRKGRDWYLNNGTGPHADVVFTYGKISDSPVAGHWGNYALSYHE